MGELCWTFSTDLNLIKKFCFFNIPTEFSETTFVCSFYNFLGSLKLNTPKMTQNRTNVLYKHALEFVYCNHYRAALKKFLKSLHPTLELMWLLQLMLHAGHRLLTLITGTSDACVMPPDWAPCRTPATDTNQLLIELERLLLLVLHAGHQLLILIICDGLILTLFFQAGHLPLILLTCGACAPTGHQLLILITCKDCDSSDLCPVQVTSFWPWLSVELVWLLKLVLHAGPQLLILIIYGSSLTLQFVLHADHQLLTLITCGAVWLLQLVLHTGPQLSIRIVYRAYLTLPVCAPCRPPALDPFYL